MNPIVMTYDPSKVIVTWNGIPITGFADGTFVKISSPSDAFTKKVGADGEVARSRTNDNTREVTITLMQTSISNNLIAKKHQIDCLTGLGTGPLRITDLMGLSLFYAPQAWPRKSPDKEYSKEVGDREWVFDTGPVVSDTEMGGMLG